MTQVPTAMRNAFSKAYHAANHIDALTSLVHSALRRKVGLVTRRSMWSIQRGNR